MKIQQRLIKVPHYSYYKQHLEIMNALATVKITATEIKILTLIMAAPSDLTHGYPFNQYVRHWVRDTLKMSSGSLGNHFNSLLSKGFLLRDKNNNKLSLNEALEVDPLQQGYQFRLEKIIEIPNEKIK